MWQSWKCSQYPPFEWQHPKILKCVCTLLECKDYVICNAESYKIVLCLVLFHSCCYFVVAEYLCIRALFWGVAHLLTHVIYMFHTKYSPVYKVGVLCQPVSLVVPINLIFRFTLHNHCRHLDFCSLFFSMFKFIIHKQCVLQLSELWFMFFPFFFQ